MARYKRGFITLADLFRAYRKAKVDAFYESSHFHAIAYARYEKSLHANLRRLLSRLSSGAWVGDLSFLGQCVFVPKSLGVPSRDGGDGVHYATLDHLQDWEASCENSTEEVSASFRQIINPTVDYQIVSALWVMKVGHKLDKAIDPGCSYGHRLRRSGGELNLDCSGLFTPYFSAYRDWRGKGLGAMRRELERDREIVAVTMDIRQFYHSVVPDFILREGFLASAGVSLSEDEVSFSSDLLASIACWYRSTPDASVRPGALPVGLSASKIISNVLLIDLDRLIKERLSPAYYGRYVDDVFLVLRVEEPFRGGRAFMSWLAERLAPAVSLGEDENGAAHLRYSVEYAEDSKIVFAGAKQKIFHLRGRYGLDLIDQIAEQIRKQSSEHRLLPVLADNESEMLSQALLATPDASLEADALRKADAVSIRRLGFSLLLRDVESYSRDLRPKEWRAIRHVFYGLVGRHVITPRGFFDYTAYICRVFGLMVASGDHKACTEFLRRFSSVCDLLVKTTSAGTSCRDKFDSAVGFYARAFIQVAMQASTVKGFRFSKSFYSVLREVRALHPDIPVRLGSVSVKQLSRDLLVSDLGRRSYREYWFKENKKERNIPAVPQQLSIHRVLRLDLVRNFRRSLNRELRAPYWPAVVFATRPFSLAEITAIAPSLLARENALRDALFSLRGARVASGAAPFASYRSESGEDPRLRISVPSIRKKRESNVVAVTSYETTDEQWGGAYQGAPDRSLQRYEKLRRLVNSILECSTRPDYVVFPELSLPRRWAFGLAIKLAQNGVSLVAGLENNNSGGCYRNDALVSLTTRWPGYRTHIYMVQPKVEPAHHELALLKNPVRKLYQPESLDVCRPLYLHGDHAFGVVICSDLTTIAHRAHFQGCVDSLFVVEWNPDLSTFAYLVESASHDLHAFIVQANNRAYGDSRIRGPFAKDYMRDVVRVRGGEENYFVVATLKIGDLRRFQTSFSPSKYQKDKEKAVFKPLPIGFPMAKFRELG